MRDVFVGSLFAIAVCLIAYQGVGLLEDYALNGAGFYAVFVALVPTGFQKVMADGRDVGDYVWFLRIALGGVTLLGLVLAVRELRAGRFRALMFWSDRSARAWFHRVFVAVTQLTLLGFLALVTWRLMEPADSVQMQGFALGPLNPTVHDVAAIFMIASLGVAVWTNTWPFVSWRDVRGEGRVRYLFIVVAMSVGAVLVWWVARSIVPGHEVIVVEWWEIALFAVFWWVETRRISKLGSGRVNDPEPQASAAVQLSPGL